MGNLFQKEKITVRFPKELRLAMLQSIVNDGYGLHGKSKWAMEAIQEFLKLNQFVDFVDIGSEAGNGELTETESFNFPITIVEELEKAVLKVREKYPTIEGIRSIIIRSSVLQKLLRNPRQVT